MPTPIWAAVIMLTSLAPSPMARVVMLSLPFLLFLSRMMLTIKAFYFGETLQASTTLTY